MDKLALALIALSALAYWSSSRFVTGPEHTLRWLALYCVAWLCYLPLCMRERLPRARWLLLCALAFRLLLLGGEPWLSDDLHRYLLDGRALRAGINPYRYAPEAEAMQQLAPELAARVNHPELPTIYPPLLPLLASLAPFDITSWRLLMSLFDLATMALVAGLFGNWRAAAIYGLCPLAVFESGANGHLEALLLALWVSAVRASIARHRIRAGLYWWLAAMSKYLPLAAMLLWARERRGRQMALAATLLSALSLWPFLRSGVDPFHSLRAYLTHWEFNGPIFGAVRAMGTPREIARGLPYVVVASLGIVLARRGVAPLRALPGLVFAFLVCGPTLHPWYALWVLPWLGSRPHRGLWAFVFAMGLGYVVWWQVERGLGWRLLPWQQLLIWSVVAAGWLFERYASGNDASKVVQTRSI